MFSQTGDTVAFAFFGRTSSGRKLVLQRFGNEARAATKQVVVEKRSGRGNQKDMAAIEIGAVLVWLQRAFG